MNLELNEEERVLLTALVESRTRELHSEIRRCMEYNYKDELKRELASYEALLGRLKAGSTSTV